MAGTLVTRKSVHKAGFSSGLGAVVRTQCRVCTLPPLIQEAINTRRTHFGDSPEALSVFFTERMREWIAEGLLPADTTPISTSSFLRHFTNHTSQVYQAQNSKSVELDILRDALQRRAELYSQSHTLFSNVYTKAQSKVEEWGRLLQAETQLRQEYYDQALAIYMEARQAYLEDVARAREAGEEIPFPVPAASRMSTLPSLPGLEKEEERILKLLGQLRQYTAEAAKIISYEEGLLNYIKIELELFLRATADASLEGLRDTEQGIALLVPPDKHEKLRTFLREYMEKQASGMRTRFKEFLRNLAQFTRQSK